MQQDNSWAGTQWDPKTGKYVDLWDVNTDRFMQWSERTCTPYIAGMPETRCAAGDARCDDAGASAAKASADCVAGGADRR